MKKTIRLTEMEEKVMKAIPEDNFYEKGFDSCLWINCFIDEVPGIETKQVRALIVTLKKKNYIGLDKECLWLEEKGKNWLIEKGLINSLNGRPIKK